MLCGPDGGAGLSGPAGSEAFGARIRPTTLPR
jgi:hypothetical protein